VIAYAAVVRARVSVLLQYRAAAFAGFCTQVFWGLIRVMILGAFYESSTRPQPLPFADVVAYVWLGQALLGMFPWNVDPDLRAMVRSGGVAYELLRPVDLYWLWFSRAIAQRTAPTLLRAVPLVLTAALLFGLRPPPSIECAAAFGLTLVGALLLSCAISVLLNLSLLWTIAGDGVARFAPAIVLVGSGMIVPLPLFPAWAQATLGALPFRGLADVPYRAYTGHITPIDASGAFVHQGLWAAGLILAGRFVLGRGLRRLEVQGG
jgi:ABC-2 type transport system permease protein